MIFKWWALLFSGILFWYVIRKAWNCLDFTSKYVINFALLSKLNSKKSKRSSKKLICLNLNTAFAIHFRFRLCFLSLIIGKENRNFKRFTIMINNILSDPVDLRQKIQKKQKEKKNQVSNKGINSRNIFWFYFLQDFT